ncbi:hypothetical protein D9M69_653610 [compost metagenome]
MQPGSSKILALQPSIGGVATAPATPKLTVPPVCATKVCAWLTLLPGEPVRALSAPKRLRATSPKFSSPARASFHAKAMWSGAPAAVRV